MRREGYEFALGMPEVVVKEVDGESCEPVERVIVDVPDAVRRAPSPARSASAAAR